MNFLSFFKGIFRSDKIEYFRQNPKDLFFIFIQGNHLNQKIFVFWIRIF